MKGRRFRFTPTWGLLIAIAILVAYAAVISSGNFLTPATLSTLTPLIAIYAVVALGQSLVIGTGGIDLSTPFTITLVGTIILDGSNEDASRLPAAIVISLVVCLLIGMVNGVLVETFGLNALVATLSVGMLVAGVTRLYRGPIDNVTSVPEALQTWARANALGASALLILTVLVIVGLTTYTWKVVVGRRLVASSTSMRAAYLLGFWSRSYRVLAYAFAAVLYGVAAICMSGLQGSPDLTLGDPFLLAPIVAVVIGGAALSGGRVNYVATGLGAIFVLLLDYELRVAGFPSGVSMFAQGLVLAVGLSLVHFSRMRSTKKSVGKVPA